MGDGLCFTFLFLVKRLEVFLVYDARELFVTSGANQILGIDALVEANYLAARGALDLKIIVVLIAVAAIAITVAIAIVTIAVTAITVALVILFHEVLLNVAKILIDLLDVIVELLNRLVKNSDLLGHLVHKVDECGDQLALCGLLIVVKTVSQALDISSLLGKIHNKISFR